MSQKHKFTMEEELEKLLEEEEAKELIGSGNHDF